MIIYIYLQLRILKALHCIIDVKMCNILRILMNSSSDPLFNLKYFNTLVSTRIKCYEASVILNKSRVSSV